MLVLVAISMISGISLLKMQMSMAQERRQAAWEREKLAALAWKKEEGEAAKEERVPKRKTMEEQQEENSWESPIDFAYLSDCNPDTVAWLRIPDTNIDYPVVQSKDNETYMSRDFYGKEKKNGTIFLDFQSELPTGTSQPKNCVFYGHYMKDGSMFRDIARYQDQTYFDAHRQIWLYTPQATLELEAVEWLSAPNSQKLREQCLTEQTNGTYVFVTCSYDGKDNRGILWVREVSRNEKQP